MAEKTQQLDQTEPQITPEAAINTLYQAVQYLKLTIPEHKHLEQCAVVIDNFIKETRASQLASVQKDVAAVVKKLKTPSEKL